MNVADATQDTDAVNLRQAMAMGASMGLGFSAWMGGGAAYSGGVFTAPSFMIQGANYGNVGAAFAAGTPV